MGIALEWDLAPLAPGGGYPVRNTDVRGGTTMEPLMRVP